MIALLWILLICSILLNLGLLAELTWVNRDFGRLAENCAHWERMFWGNAELPDHPDTYAPPYPKLT